MLEFRETSLFTRRITEFLSDDEYRSLQSVLVMCDATALHMRCLPRYQCLWSGGRFGHRPVARSDVRVHSPRACSAEYRAHGDHAKSRWPKRPPLQRLSSNACGVPELGSVIPGTAGLRKVRWSQSRRQKGKRGGIRIIYYWYASSSLIYLLLAYSKDELDDLTASQKRVLVQLVAEEFR